LENEDVEKRLFGELYDMFVDVMKKYEKQWEKKKYEFILALVAILINHENRISELEEKLYSKTRLED